MATDLHASKTTRFDYGPNDEDITIIYRDSDKEFEVQDKGITGPILHAMDDAFDPEIPQGARLLVDANTASVDKPGFYVFRKSGSERSFDIAFVQKLDDGSYRYALDKEHPEILADLNNRQLVGRVWEAQIIVEIKDGGTVGDNWTPHDSSQEDKFFKVWWPLWTAKW